MSSAAALINARTLLPMAASASLALIVYGARSWSIVDLRVYLEHFFMGPGRKSRITLLIFCLLNLKSLPLGWTYRVIGTMIRHRLFMRGPVPPKALFHYCINSSSTTPLEIDYNLHKSNSTFFADNDVSRCHLIMHLLGPGIKAAGDNAKTRIVITPQGKPAKGGLAAVLGGAFFSFRKEVPVFRGYEMWTRVVSWDRKWLYLVTHFVAKGKVRPASWDGGSSWGSSGPVGGARLSEEELQKHVIASAFSKYVFKMNRFTVHPAILLQESGLLPPRPGGWRAGELEVGTATDLAEPEGDEWTWERVEWQRQQGMKYAQNFIALDQVTEEFDGGVDGALGRFSPG